MPTKKTNNLKLIFSLGIVILFLLLFLIVYAKMVVMNIADNIEQDYETKIEDLQNRLQEDANSLVSRGSIVPRVNPFDPVKGEKENFKLTIIEYGDFQCPFCADMAKDLDRIIIKYPEVRVVWKDLPNPAHLQARRAALAARCAQEQDKFWEYHDLLFENQADLNAMDVEEDFYIKLAEQLELNTEQFQICMDSKKYIQEVTRGIEDAEKYEIDATPYLFIGSKRVDQYIPYQELEDIVESMLKGGI